MFIINKIFIIIFIFLCNLNMYSMGLKDVFCVFNEESSDRELYDEELFEEEMPKDPSSIFREATRDPRKAVFDSFEDSPRITKALESLFKIRGYVDGVYSERKMTLIHYLAYCKRIDELYMMIENDADLSFGDREGNTALHTAARKNFFDIVKVLVEYSNKSFKEKDIINLKNIYGDTPLAWAIRYHRYDKSDNFELIRYLIQNGAYVDKQIFEMLKERIGDEELTVEKSREIRNVIKKAIKEHKKNIKKEKKERKKTSRKRKGCCSIC